MAQNNLKWETVDGRLSEVGKVGEIIRRARVPGGWLVQATTVADARAEDGEGEFIHQITQFTESMVFLPDPGHSWQIEPVTEDTNAEFTKDALLARVYN